MALWLGGSTLVLASQSESRHAILQAAGIPHEVEPAQIDERRIEQRAPAGNASEMVALDTLKELDSDFLQLIAADACRSGTSDTVEIRFQKRFAEFAHGQPRDLAMLEHHQTVACDRNCRVQLMGSAPQVDKLLPRSRSVRWFREPVLAGCQSLIGA